MASSTSSPPKMSQDQAQWLFTEGATFVFLDVPTGTEFGMDYNSWEVGDKFKGVKMIPPGIHFVYYSAVGCDKQTAPRTGFMYNFRRQEVLIKTWDAQAEDIKPETTTSEEQERVERSKRDLDRYLACYPYETYKKWVSLTNHITPTLLEHLQPINGKISAVTPLQSVGSTTQSRRDLSKSAEEDATSSGNRRLSGGKYSDDGSDARLPQMTPFPGTQIRFTDIPRRKFPDGAGPLDITRYNMDHSYVLRTLLATDAYIGNPLGLLGELQFSFVCFLLGQTFDGFEQWKRLVHLLCSCVEALADQSALYLQFISVLHYHIEEIPEDFFVDIVSRDNFLADVLRVFFENLEVSEASTELKKKGGRFRAHLEKRFKWDFGNEQEEYAPAVVVL